MRALALEDSGRVRAFPSVLRADGPASRGLALSMRYSS
jgi:hypothetical protein